MRALRKVAEDTRNHDFERDIYIEERKAERGVYCGQIWEDLKKEGWKNWLRNAMALVTQMVWIAIIGLYWALSDYGRSFVRPFGWLVASWFFFYWGYTDVLVPKACFVSADKYEHAVGMLVLGNAVPFVGPLNVDAEIKKFLFCPLGNCPSPIIPPEGYQALVLGQNLLSIVLIFFIGLALRNYFKIK